MNLKYSSICSSFFAGFRTIDTAFILGAGLFTAATSDIWSVTFPGIDVLLGVVTFVFLDYGLCLGP